MISLSSTQSLQIVLAGAKNTNDASFNATYTDTPSCASANPPVNGSNNTVTNGVTAVTAVAAPGTGFNRVLTGLALFNADLAAITITLQVVDTVGPATTIIQKVTRQTLENFVYEQSKGWQSFDVNGATIAQAATTSANASTALSAGTSAGTQASSNTSALTSDSATISVAQSAGISAGTSSSVLASTAGSTGASAGVSAGTSASTLGSTATSTLTSRVSSKGG